MPRPPLGSEAQVTDAVSCTGLPTVAVVGEAVTLVDDGAAAAGAAAARTAASAAEVTAHPPRVRLRLTISSFGMDHLLFR
ncbi:hypothetical protein Shyhy01_42190 [Streptomyces hygroscopicus subsp. hygroscopicus]|nr:hypothetical protein Shyhy01_42190 [Streptomyces hygroscopicus subsp. hygroscopicus]